MSVAEIRVEPGSSLAGLAIGSKALREKTDAIIVATRCPKTGCCERNPDRASRLKAGANVIAMGAKEELERLRRAAAPLPQRSFRTSLADMLARASMRPGR